MKKEDITYDYLVSRFEVAEGVVVWKADGFDYDGKKAGGQRDYVMHKGLRMTYDSVLAALETKDVTKLEFIKKEPNSKKELKTCLNRLLKKAKTPAQLHAVATLMEML